MKPEKVYACYTRDKDLRLSSSSGAIFSSLAEYVFGKNGIVYGVAMSEDCYSAEFIAVTDRNGLTKLRGSKYLQAKVGNTYKWVKDDLLAGKQVLFSGTGCQVNGLKNFLGKDYDNLLCVAVICHGAPSPALWKKYAEYQEKKNCGKLKGINFRCKDDSWTDFGMKEVLTEIPQSKAKQLYISKDEDSYMQMFLRDNCLRPSCYDCVAKKVKMEDLTIADFWGWKKVDQYINADDKGISLLLVNTEKGRHLFSEIVDRIHYLQTDTRHCLQPNLEHPSLISSLRVDFEQDFISKGFVYCAKKYGNIGTKHQIFCLLRKLKHKILG